MALSAEQMESALSGASRGSLIFVSYLAGREPTPRAIVEARRATEELGIARRHFVGTLESVRTTKRGERIMTVFAHNRDRLTAEGFVEGNYRSFNPALGQLLAVEVLN